jgi:hypothetical protein
MAINVMNGFPSVPQIKGVPGNYSGKSSAVSSAGSFEIIFKIKT